MEFSLSRISIGAPVLPGLRGGANRFKSVGPLVLHREPFSEPIKLLLDVRLFDSLQLAL